MDETLRSLEELANELDDFKDLPFMDKNTKYRINNRLQRARGIISGAADQARVRGSGWACCDCGSVNQWAALRCMNPECIRNDKPGFKINQPAPVVERFVMWDLVETDQYAWAGHVLQPCFRRVRRGDVVATRHENGEWWRVTFPDGQQDCFINSTYQALKRNGCFGDQV